MREVGLAIGMLLLGSLVWGAWQVAALLGATRGEIIVSALLLLVSMAGGVWYVASVLKYARVDLDMRLLRDQEFPQKLMLKYKPLSGGQLAVRGGSAVQPLEMIKQVSPGDAGVQRKIGILWSGVQPGDRVRVKFRNGWWTATKDLAVPPSPRPVANATQPPAT